MIADPLFYLAAVPGVILVGLSKGGFGGMMGVLATPMIALAVPPMQAAAIMLPIMLVMDAVALVAWRGIFDRRTLILLLPGGVLGVALGWALAASVTPEMVRLVVGAVALAFVARHLLGGGTAKAPRPHSPPKGLFWGAASGFTSFVSHAGGPPYQMYVLPLRLDPRRFAGTAAIFFAAINLLKVGPYFALGQFSATNLLTSLALLPLAPLATLAGVRLVKIVRPETFYRVIYVMVLVVALKLIRDGLQGL
ncbi:MAG TPA: sulfite exporter TauE/SafE family protein [Afifellaceae bacterium]|nr:sulfite exporter TauE/SafE family protein [Afifellaceae bacterium]